MTVQYEEKLYAIGKIPGSFLRREGRAGEHATLTARLIDRPIRPMFADGFRNEVQIVNTVMSVDPDATPEMAAMLGSSLALCISDIPFDGPIAGVYVGRVDGKFIINPTVEQWSKSDIKITVAGTKDAINRVEAGADQVPEDEMLDALMFGHEAIKRLCDWQVEIAKEIGKEKRVVELYKIDETIEKDVTDRSKERLCKAISIFDKLERQDAIDAIENEILDDYDTRLYPDEKTHQKIPALFQFPGQRRQALPVFKTVHVGRFPAPVRRAQKIAGQRPIFRPLSQIQHGTQPDALFMEKQVRPAAAVQVEFFAGKTPGRAENKFLPVFPHRPVPRAVCGQNFL